MDDISEYRKRHQEAYRKRNNLNNDSQNTDINDPYGFKSDKSENISNTATTSSNTIDHAHPTTVGPAVSSPDYLSLKSRATPGDRGGGEGGDRTSSGLPAADLREAEGEANKRGSTPSGTVVDKTSAGTPSGGNMYYDGMNWQQVSDNDKQIHTTPSLWPSSPVPDDSEEFGDPLYQSSVELARRLQEELNRPQEQDNIRRPDDTYQECLLGSCTNIIDNNHQFDDGNDLDLQAAIAKSLIDM